MFLKTLKYQHGGCKRICCSSFKGDIIDVCVLGGGGSVQRYGTTVFKIMHVIMSVWQDLRR